MEILAQFLGIQMGDDFPQDFGGTILHSAEAREQHSAGDAAPGAVAQPGLAFAGPPHVCFDAGSAGVWEARTLGCAPPARAGQGKAQRMVSSS